MCLLRKVSLTIQLHRQLHRRHRAQGGGAGGSRNGGLFGWETVVWYGDLVTVGGTGLVGESGSLPSFSQLPRGQTASYLPTYLLPTPTFFSSRTPAPVSIYY